MWEMVRDWYQLIHIFHFDHMTQKEMLITSPIFNFCFCTRILLFFNGSLLIGSGVWYLEVIQGREEKLYLCAGSQGAITHNFSSFPCQDTPFIKLLLSLWARLLFFHFYSLILERKTPLFNRFSFLKSEEMRKESLVYKIPACFFVTLPPTGL